MKIQKIIAVSMILSSSVLSGMVMEEIDIAYPGILCMLGLIGLQRKFTWDIKPRRRIISTLLPFLLLIIFALQYRFSVFPGTTRFNPTPVMAWETITRYFLALMILVLFLGVPHKLPASLGLYHLANTICAGQLLLLDGMDAVYRPLELASVVLLALYVTSMHLTDGTDSPSGAKSRIALCYASGVALIVTLNIGWIFGSILYRHQSQLDVLGRWFWGQENAMLSSGDSEGMIGCSGHGKLSNLLRVKQDQENLVALRIDCDECPGYLRAKAFDKYLPSESEWQDQSAGDAQISQQSSLLSWASGKRHAFSLNRRIDQSKCRKMSIHHRQRYPNVMFTPLGTASVVAAFQTLMYDDDDIVWRQHKRTSLDYDLWFNRAQYRNPPQALLQRRMLHTAKRLDPRIKRLAQDVFSECETSKDKIKAVKQHFRDNYSYSLAMDIPPDQERLAAFLLDEASGYCEYFASGAAILLRYGGVPTRYITGFLVTEKDPLTRAWVAKNENAHAWVEAWNVEQRRWETVEATPQEDSASTVLDDDANAAGSRFVLLRQFLDAFYLYGFAGPVVWLFEHNSLLITVPALFLILVSVTVLMRRRRARQHSETDHPHVLRLHHMLRRADLFLKKRGLVRHESETLHAFAQRLQDRSSDPRSGSDLAEWYLDYAGIRYCREISTEHVQRLSHGLKRLV